MSYKIKIKIGSAPNFEQYSRDSPEPASLPRYVRMWRTAFALAALLGAQALIMGSQFRFVLNSLH